MIVVGIGYSVIHGFNWGIDFKGGLSQNLQIAPVAFSVANTSDKSIDFVINKDDISISIKGDKAGPPLPRSKYQTLAEFAAAIESTRDLKLTFAPGQDFSPSSILPVKVTLDPGKSVIVNHGLPKETTPQVSIDDMRDVLSAETIKLSIKEIGDPDNQESLFTAMTTKLSVQQINELIDQEFIVRVGPTAFNKTGITKSQDDFFAQISKIIINSLEKKYGNNNVIEWQNESLSEQLAQTFLAGSVIAIVVAMILIIIYVTIRFRFDYAVASIIALIHDTLSTIGFIGLFHVEINTAVVAALLTIIGYSMNDTIVIFDRIRENEKLLKGKELGTIMDISITQTLSRSIYTHVTTFMAMLPIFILGTGPVKDFSFCMLFGIIVGAYSSVCNASPIVLLWEKALARRRRAKGIEPTAKAPDIEMKVTATDYTGEKQVLETTPGTPATAPELFSTGTGPVTRTQRVLEKKKKKKHRF
jgi:preprotein translocase subunit SecF